MADLDYAIPEVIVGAHYAASGKRVIGMTSDGSFGMSVGELETISRLDCRSSSSMTSNGSFGWIKELQHLYHQDRYFSVDFNPVDYATIARGIGLASTSGHRPGGVQTGASESAGGWPALFYRCRNRIADH